MIRRPPRSTQGVSSAASDVYKRQVSTQSTWGKQKMRQEESDIKFNMNNEDKKLMDYYHKAIMEDKMSRGGSWGSNFYYKLNESPESQENHGELIYRELPKNVYVWHLCLTNINVILLSTWGEVYTCLLYTSPSPRDLSTSRMPSSA
eukprot:TRINITY_DN14300_c0_g1_i3.p1 TRINITY_DN14300_c0_g1~~TRINITY_DN14300_c0_g1_i3.p1  ORF type:complete len:147 (+),score=35.28 TRINITY_DN14300_c0_g1_i3:126-566(+)